ncbi:hypothetical protein ACJZ2D_001454 [Fusarium nematophilum]
MSAMIPLMLLGLGSLHFAAAQHYDAVTFKTPEVIEAGDPFTVFVDLANTTWPNRDCWNPWECKWEYMRVLFMANPTYGEQRGPGLWGEYCYLEGCVATNVTSFETAIPRNVFPNGGPYSLDYFLFGARSDDVRDPFRLEFSLGDATNFNVTNSVGNYTEYTCRRGYYGIEDHLPTVPCEAVPCVQECQTEFVAPCLAENATVVEEESETGTSTDEATATATDSGTDESGTNNAAGFKVVDVGWVMVLSCLAMAAGFVVEALWDIRHPDCEHTSGRAFYTESREAGGTGIVEIKNYGLEDVLPAKYSAKNTVYEYGGSTYAILPDGRIIFSNKGDTVHILNVDTKEVSSLTGSSNLRYSDFDAHPTSPWVLANQEDHEHDTPDQVRNYIVAINTETAHVKRILDNADFYYTPYFSPDGTKLVWLEWNHPDLLFDAAKLYSASWHSDGSISDISLIAGNDHEGVAEPRWGPDGSLFFGKEIDGYRRLFRISPYTDVPVQVKLGGLDNSEFGEIRLFQGSHTYAPLSSRYVVAAPIALGVSRLILIDSETGSWRELGNASTLSEIMLDSIARLDDSSFLIMGAGTTTAKALYRVELGDPDRITKLRGSTEEAFPEAIYSKPEALCISSKDKPHRDIHGFLWLPHNPEYTAPDGDLPPLITVIHGGPTSYMGLGLKLRTQYFTSRGYAYLALNYAGSSGHGRKYRESLFGNFGLVDSDDAAEFANYLAEAGKTRHGAAGITGVSAGGYNTLRTLTRHPLTFAGGVCLSGISDLKLLDDSTHKLESDYTDHLVLAPGVDKANKDRICRERSPLYDADKIRAPLLLLHGSKDRVTPLDQAQQMADAIKGVGGDVKLIVAPDEGHGFSQPGNVRMWLEEEEKWWRKTLL